MRKFLDSTRYLRLLAAVAVAVAALAAIASCDLSFMFDKPSEGRSVARIDTDLSFIPVPFPGAEPLASFSRDGYTGEVTWLENGAVVTGAFKQRKFYTAVVAISPEAGYKFTGKDVFTHGSAESAAQEYKSGSYAVTLSFAELPRLVATTDISFIPGPQPGAVPFTSFETPEYSMELAWFENGASFSGNFAQQKQYMAIATIRAFEGSSFTGDEQFTHSGASEVEQEFWGGVFTVTLRFPAPSGDSSEILSSTDLSFIPAPFPGNSPMRSFATPRFKGELSWWENGVAFSGAFRQRNAYTATISITADNGHIFAGDEAFTHDGASKIEQARKGDGYSVTLEFATVSELVSLTDLSFVAAPVYAKTPYASFANMEYQGTVSWLENGQPYTGIFRESKAYSAYIELTAAAGFGFAGDEQFTHSGATGIDQRYRGSSWAVTLYFPSVPDLASTTDLSFIPFPFAGEAPLQTFSTPEYKGEISWTWNGSAVAGNFVRSRAYMATIELTVNDGFIFSGNEIFSHGAATKIEQIISSNTVSLTVYFPEACETIPAANTVLSMIPAPSTGLAPLPAFSASEYRGAIEWRQNGLPFAGNFLQGTEYVAVVTITPQAGWSFSGFAGVFSHPGAASVSQSIAGEIATVTIYFRRTANTVSLTNLSAITAPAGGGSPMSSFSNAEYAASITWLQNSAGHSGAFNEGYAYTAVAMITPNAGYSFASFTGTFSHPSAASVTQALSGASMQVWVEFPRIKISAANTQPVRIYGERYEKYRYILDPGYANVVVTGSASAYVGSVNVSAGNPSMSAGIFSYAADCYNDFTFTATVSNFLSPGTRDIAVTGHVVGRMENLVGSLPQVEGFLIDVPFYSTSAITDTITRDISQPLNQERDTLASFTASSLSLPNAGSYSSDYKEMVSKTFSFTYTKAEMDSWAAQPSPPSQSGWNLRWGWPGVFTPMGQAMTATAPTIPVQYAMECRGFYQYRSVTVQYPAGAVLLGFEPLSTLVASYNYNAGSNELTVAFNAYNSGVTGNVLSFLVQGEDGTLAPRVISIN